MYEEYIAPELLVLVPVLYLIGEGIKRTESVDSRYIPLILGIVGIVMACLWIHPSSAEGFFTAIVQGVLCAGASVYINQVWKQTKKD